MTNTGLIPADNSYQWAFHVRKIVLGTAHLFFFFLTLVMFIFFFSFIFISWRLISLQYCSGFVIHWHESAMDLHVSPIPIPPSHLPLHPIPLGLPSAPGPSTCLMHTHLIPTCLTLSWNWVARLIWLSLNQFTSVSQAWFSTSFCWKSVRQVFKDSLQRLGTLVFCLLLPLLPTLANVCRSPAGGKCL